MVLWPRIGGGGFAAVGLELQAADARVLLDQGLDRVPGAIGAAVIDENDLGGDGVGLLLGGFPAELSPDLDGLPSDVGELLGKYLVTVIPLTLLGLDVTERKVIFMAILVQSRS